MVPERTVASPSSDAESVAVHSVQSNGSNHSGWSQWSTQFSGTFKSRFPWLVSKYDDEQFRDAKEQEILECLSGDGRDEVDLWRLRELALQKGGLMSSSIRKRAWPKLVGAYEQVLRHAASSDPSSASIQVVELSRHDMQMLTKEVAHCIWSMEDHFRQHKEDTEKSKKQVSFASATTEAVQVKSISIDLHDMEDEEENGSKILRSPLSGTITPQSHGTLESFTLSTRATRWSRPSIKEQRALYNVICSVLKVMPEEGSPYFEDDRYHYYSGLQNLTAVMLINLESPSLTSLVFGQLAKHNLRDAMRKAPASAGSRSILHQAVDTVFMPLLQHVDADVHDHLTKCAPSSVVASWVATWFCQDVAHLAVASRLVDVFLVSHALMPLYFSVALIVQHRPQILQIEPSKLTTIHSTLRSLPFKLGSRNGTNNLESMSMVEELIDNAVSNMNRIPPDRLLQDSLKYHRRRGNPIAQSVVASIALFQQAPTWMTASVAPTDWALLQQAKAMRNHENGAKPKAPLDTKTTSSGEKRTRKDYPLASAAAGVTTTSSFVTSNMFKLVVLLALLACGTVAIVTGIHTHGSKTSTAASRQLLLGFDSMFSLRRLVLSKGEPDPLLLFLQRRFRETKQQELAQRRMIPLALPSTALPNKEAASATLVSLSEDVVNILVEETTPTLQLEELVATELEHAAIEYEDGNMALESRDRSRTFIPPLLRQSLEKLKHAWGHVQSWLKLTGFFFQN